MTALVDEAPPPEETDGGARLPHDPIAEASVLGAGLLSVDALDAAILAGLKGDHFYEPRHEVIYSAMLAAFEDGEVIDPVVLADRLRTSNDLGRVGGPVYLHTLMSQVPSAANAGYYAGIVRDKALQRQVIAAGQRISAIGYSASSIPDMLAHAEETIHGVTDTTLGLIGSGIADDLDGVFDRIESGINTISTPWADLNQLIGGWVRGNLYVIGAYTGGGKSIAGLQAAVDIARRHRLPAGYCSLEMTRDQLIHRAIAQLGPVDLGRLSRGGDAMRDEDWRAAFRARSVLETGTTARGGDDDPLPLHLVDKAAMTLTDIRAAARATERRWGQPPGLLVVDFLQLMKSATRAESRQVEVAAFAYGLKELALDLAVPVVALAQLNRAPQQARRKPALSDLRESGAIEQAADLVALMSREEDDDGNETDFVTFDVAKARQGAPGEVVLRWEGRHSRLLDPARDEDGRLAL